MIQWIIGYRKKQEGLLEKGEPFLFINPWYGWCADPFIFETDTDVYIFSEIWNYFKQRGSIGYCKLMKNNKFSKWRTIIAEKYHMSYPFIWKDNAGIHICAETSGNESIYMMQLSFR